jgi:DNA topoisomerase-2
MSALRKNDIVTLSELDHVLKRPGQYVGSVKEEIVNKWVYDEFGKMTRKSIPFIPALLKIVEEVIDNSIDEAIRTEFKYANRISVTIKEGRITVHDNGRGLPIEKIRGGKYITQNIFTELRTGSNFDDEKRSQVEMKGMNGVGVSLTNIFSEELTVHTANGSHSYKQKFELGPVKRNPPKVGDSKQNFTEVTFIPNYAYFEASDEALAILPNLIERALRNAAFCFPEVTFKFNGKRLPGGRMKEFMENICETFEYNENAKVRLGVMPSEDGFQHISFVNGLETVRGGAHVDYAMDWLVHHIREHIAKKFKFDVKPADIRNNLFIMLNFRLGAPDFDSQTKERLTTPAGEWKERFDGIFSDRFMRQIVNNKDIIDPIVEAYRIKKEVADRLDLKRLSATKKVERIRVEKYLPATKHRKYLVLTEGDSAKGPLAGPLGREEFSYFPLRGKPLNAYEAKVERIKANKEIEDIVKITGMRLDVDIQKNFRYENILIAADQDADGIHIRALLLSFFGRFAPSLIAEGRIKYLRTPLVLAKRNGRISQYFFDLQSYNRAKNKGELAGASLKYYKGLGTFDSKVLKALIEKEGVEHFIVTLTFGDDQALSLNSINEWIGSDSELRKKHLRGKSFDINAV